ncbi:MAG: DinB family protein [Stappiaceae bacterium]
MPTSLNEIEAEWIWTRGLTRDLLGSCFPSDLTFALTEASGPLWKQFRHIGRVHENYLDALATRHVDFSVKGGSYDGSASKPALLSYFAALEDRHKSCLSKADPVKTIDWMGEPISLDNHLIRLLAHESLHHGQLILYWRALERDFPPSWQSWGM